MLDRLSIELESRELSDFSKLRQRIIAAVAKLESWMLDLAVANNIFIARIFPLAS